MVATKAAVDLKTVISWVVGMIGTIHIVLKKIYTFVATPRTTRTQPHEYEQFALLSLPPVISLP